MMLFCFVCITSMFWYSLCFLFNVLFSSVLLCSVLICSVQFFICVVFMFCLLMLLLVAVGGCFMLAHGSIKYVLKCFPSQAFSVSTYIPVGRANRFRQSNRPTKRALQARTATNTPTKKMKSTMQPLIRPRPTPTSSCGALLLYCHLRCHLQTMRPRETSEWLPHQHR